MRHLVLFAFDALQLFPVERDAAGAVLAPLIVSVSRSQHLPYLFGHLGPVLRILVVAARQDPLGDLYALLIEEDLAVVVAQVDRLAETKLLDHRVDLVSGYISEQSTASCRLPALAGLDAPACGLQDALAALRQLLCCLLRGPSGVHLLGLLCGLRCGRSVPAWTVA
eukprot:7385084-Prymnesium_polylepis.1